MKTVTNLQELCEVSHAMAVEKGWWPEGEERSLTEIFNNFHAEISEAWEEYRAGRMEMWFAEGSQKPEGFWVEIADLLIRMADWCGSCHQQREPAVVYLDASPRTIPLVVADLHFHCNTMYSVIRIAASKDRGSMAWVLLAECFNIVALTKPTTDIWPIINRKLSYNATRPHRHGGKLA